MKKKRKRLAFQKAMILFSIALLLSTFIPQKKAHAIAPLLIWAAEAIVVDIALEQGWKYAKKSGMTAKAKKVAQDVVDNVIHYDFAKKKPIKKADGKIDIDVSANDRAKIARQLADLGEDIILANDDRERTNTSKPKYSLDVASTDPMADTSIEINVILSADTPNERQALDFVNKLWHFKFTPVAYAKKTKVEMISAVDGQIRNLGELDGGSALSPKSYTLRPYYNTGSSYTMSLTSGSWTSSYSISSYSSTTSKSFQAYINAVTLANTKIFYADGIMIPETVKNVYPAPINMAPDYKLPNYEQLKDRPVRIDVELPDTVDVELDWEDSTYLTKIETEINEEYNKMDVTINNNYDYSTQVINNYYTDKNYDVKAPDIEPEIETPPPTDGDGDGDTGGSKSPYEGLLSVAILLAIVDLLFSIVLYIGRFVTFIVSIPLIPPKEFDLPGFTWFKNSTFLGVPIYSTMLGLATLGLSMTVYKLVRRML